MDINNLGDLALQEVFSFLPLVDLCRCEGACSAWRGHIGNQYTTRDIDCSDVRSCARTPKARLVRLDVAMKTRHSMVPCCCVRTILQTKGGNTDFFVRIRNDSNHMLWEGFAKVAPVSLVDQYLGAVNGETGIVSELQKFFFECASLALHLTLEGKDQSLGELDRTAGPSVEVYVVSNWGDVGILVNTKGLATVNPTATHRKKETGESISITFLKDVSVDAPENTAHSYVTTTFVARSKTVGGHVKTEFQVSLHHSS